MVNYSKNKTFCQALPLFILLGVIFILYSSLTQSPISTRAASDEDVINAQHMVEEIVTSKMGRDSIVAEFEKMTAEFLQGLTSEEIKKTILGKIREMIRDVLGNPEKLGKYLLEGAEASIENDESILIIINGGERITILKKDIDKTVDTILQRAQDDEDINRIINGLVDKIYAFVQEFKDDIKKRLEICRGRIIEATTEAVVSIQDIATRIVKEELTCVAMFAVKSRVLQEIEGAIKTINDLIRGPAKDMINTPIDVLSSLQNNDDIRELIEKLPRIEIRTFPFTEISIVINGTVLSIINEISIGIKRLPSIQKEIKEVTDVLLKLIGIGKDVIATLQNLDQDLRNLQSIVKSDPINKEQCNNDVLFSIDARLDSIYRLLQDYDRTVLSSGKDDIITAYAPTSAYFVGEAAGAGGSISIIFQHYRDGKIAGPPVNKTYNLEEKNESILRYMALNSSGARKQILDAMVQVLEYRKEIGSFYKSKGGESSAWQELCNALVQCQQPRTVPVPGIPIPAPGPSPADANPDPFAEPSMPVLPDNQQGGQSGNQQGAVIPPIPPGFEKIQYMVFYDSTTEGEKFTDILGKFSREKGVPTGSVGRYDVEGGKYKPTHPINRAIVEEMLQRSKYRIRMFKVKARPDSPEFYKGEWRHVADPTQEFMNVQELFNGLLKIEKTPPQNYFPIN